MNKSTKAGTMAEVKIDFEKKEININPTYVFKSEWQRLNHLFTYYCLFVFIPVWIFVSFYFFLILNLSWFYETHPAKFYESIIFSTIITLLFIGFGLMLYHLINPKYADAFFAKMNGWYSFKKKNLIINNIKQKELLIYIPDFSNISLKYELTKDYSKQISSIDVVKLNDRYSKDDFRRTGDNKYWGLLFKFLEIPQDGQIELKYV